MWKELRVTHDARAFWVTGPGTGEIRAEAVPEPGPHEVRVRTLRSAISRGTERLVHRGGVPTEQYLRMRAPFQAGDFPWPVKYGYLNVGVVDAGPENLVGRTVFCLYPHQTRYVVPAHEVTLVPDGMPPSRAVLIGTMETAINALWDAPALLGDRVAVVGAGMVGCCLAHLLARMPGVHVTLVDIDPARADVARALGVSFALPGEADGERDLVFHASASAAGLRTSLELLAADSSMVELSWYGDGEVALPLGGDFHSRRLGIRASQVGTIAPNARRHWTPAQRRDLAAQLLRDDALGVLLTDETPFDALPALMERIAAGLDSGICSVVTYEGDQ